MLNAIEPSTESQSRYQARGDTAKVYHGDTRFGNITETSNEIYEHDNHQPYHDSVDLPQSKSNISIV